MENKTLHIVIVGHVDHGKSTLVGRLRYDTGSLSQEKMDEVRISCEKLGRKFEFAYLMDNFEEERNRGITIDIAHAFFSTAKRRYVIIDAPGHKEFLKNMISGTSQAEAALLLIDISCGIQEQTLRHCFILSLLGIRQTAVIVNKMDLVDYSEEKFNKIRKEIIEILNNLKITPSAVIPISAMDGENIASESKKIPWYEGPSVLSALESFDNLELEALNLRLPIQDIYEINGETIAVGRVESGKIRKGQEVLILPRKEQTRIKSIKKFMEDDIAEAPTMDCIGITADTHFSRGDIVVNSDSAIITDTINANIFWLIDQEYSLGIPVLFKCATQEVKARITKICRRFDPASIDLVESDSKIIKPAEVAEVEIKLEKNVVVDKFSDIPELGRFVLEHEGVPVASGIII